MVRLDWRYIKKGNVTVRSNALRHIKHLMQVNIQVNQIDQICNLKHRCLYGRYSALRRGEVVSVQRNEKVPLYHSKPFQEASPLGYCL